MAEPLDTAPFSTYRSSVREEWLDYNGHLHDASYAVVLSDANEELFEALGLSADYRRDHAASMFTVEHHLRYLAECRADDELTAATTLVAADARKMRLRTELYAGGRLAATGESLYLHVDTDRGKVTPMPEDRRRAVARLLCLHAATAGPAQHSPPPPPDRVVTPYEGTGIRPWSDDLPVPAPLRLHGTTVPPAWVDYNGHMSESCYLLAFGDNADVFFRFLGIDEDYRAGGHSLYTVETRLHHHREAGEGDPLTMTLRLLDHDDKRVHVFHEMHHGASGELLASAEQMLVHVDMAAQRSSPLPEELQHRLAVILDSHRTLPVPTAVGRPMGIRRRD
jgi:acyl-CoA thioester hydrolase